MYIISDLNLNRVKVFAVISFIVLTLIILVGSHSLAESNADLLDVDRKAKYRGENQNDPPGNWGVGAVRAPEIWSRTMGKGVVVAVIDSGISFHGSSFKDNIWRNVDEVPGDGIDNDDNGYVDDVHGWDFWDDDPSSLTGSSVNEHGTFISGIIAGKPESVTSLYGVAPGVKLMDLRVLDGKGQFYIEDWKNLVDAITYAVENGADVINISIYSTLKPPNSVHRAIKEARRKNVLVVGISGNGGIEVDFFGQWEEVLTIGAVDEQRKVWNYSNHGSEVDLVGPGVNISSFVPGGKVVKKSGTSFAAAHVTGVASLVISAHPGVSAAELSSLLKKSATDLLSPGYDPQTGYGLVNAKKAMDLLDN